MSELAVVNKKQKPLEKFKLQKLKQLSMLEPLPNAFGGSLLTGRRKERRPLTTKKAIHLIIKGDISVSGSLVAKRNWIKKEVQRLSEKFFIKVYDEPGIERNHIHFTIKISSVENYKKFIKALTGRLAQVLKIKFLFRPFTKLVEWGRHFKRTLGYVRQNTEAAVGIRPYKPRTKYKPRCKSASSVSIACLAQPIHLGSSKINGRGDNKCLFQK